MKRSITVFSLFLSGVLGTLAVGSPAHAELRKFNLYTVEVDGVKMWMPSTLTVNKGDDVEITAVVKARGNPPVHGLMIEAFKIVEVADDKGKTIKFKANKKGIYTIRCHLHPPHVGSQLVVID